MNDSNVKIVVSGDICTSLLIWRTHDSGGMGYSWEHYPQVHHTFETGEALLLAKLVALATAATVLSPQMNTDALNLNGSLLRSTLEVALFPKTVSGAGHHDVYRVQEFLGFTGPVPGALKHLAIENDDPQVDLVILDDENNGFNVNEAFWPLALTTPGTQPVIIYKTNDPNPASKLWQCLEASRREQTIVVMNGDDLRAQGVNISKSLSWEKTALDFVWQINNNPNLTFLADCRHLIVPFGLEGAIYYRNDGSAKFQLYFLTSECEGDFIKENQGKMYGLTSCFVAGLARRLVMGFETHEELGKSLEEGIREGIVAAQKYFLAGFGENLKDRRFPDPGLFTESATDFIFKEQIQDVPIRNTNNPNCQACWYIIKDKSSTNLAEIAYDIVKNGEQSALKFIPIAQFGRLKTVDRTEIEGYRSIKNLIGEYVTAKNTVRPLSIAVYGTPGSGKSFGVTEVASSIAPKLIETLNFNLSQFQSVADLIVAFHKVRDLSLGGKVPLVFFDEFDAAFDGKLGWLKYFLAPMQDGIFREGDALHPIGKTIFVFAGGTSSTFEEFCGETIENAPDYHQFLKAFQSAKGPDFISRLRGYVNILGPNQTDEQWDQLFIIRRAMLLRALLERKTPHLINDRGEAQIDNGVLRAMLKVARYKHESRSMEAILEMSRLNSAKKWEQSHLPSKEQLKLHVDEDQFFRHLMHDAFFSEKIEQLAMNLQAAHILVHTAQDAGRYSWLRPWDALDEEARNALREQVKSIPDALHRINYEVISVKDRPEAIRFTTKELTILAEYEHKRWSLRRKKAGWKYGDRIDEAQKTLPELAPWESLPVDIQNRIMEKIKAWPGILADCNFKIERLKSLCYCETQGLMPPVSGLR